MKRVTRARRRPPGDRSRAGRRAAAPRMQARLCSRAAPAPGSGHVAARARRPHAGGQRESQVSAELPRRRLPLSSAPRTGMELLLIKAGPCSKHGATVAMAPAETRPGEEGTHKQAHDRLPGAEKKNSQDEKECGGRGQGRPLGKVALEEKPTRGEVNMHAISGGRMF